VIGSGAFAGCDIAALANDLNPAIGAQRRFMVPWSCWAWRAMAVESAELMRLPPYRIDFIDTASVAKFLRCALKVPC
jgi:hypothetical protein